MTMDCAHDQLTLGVTGSTCSGQFIILQCVYCERDVSIAARSASEARDTIQGIVCAGETEGGLFHGITVWDLHLMFSLQAR